MLCVEETEKCEHCGRAAKLELVQRNPDIGKRAEIPYIAVYECGGCGKTTFVDIREDKVELIETGDEVKIICRGKLVCIQPLRDVEIDRESVRWKDANGYTRVLNRKSGFMGSIK